MHGDCLEAMSSIPTHSVDLVLTDPPYGTMGGMGKSINNKTGQFKRQQDAAKWDKVIDIEAMWQQLHRIVRPNGMVLLFSQEPFTTKLIMSANYGMPFCYRMAWHKNQFGTPCWPKSPRLIITKTFVCSPASPQKCTSTTPCAITFSANWPAQNSPSRKSTNCWATACPAITLRRAFSLSCHRPKITPNCKPQAFGRYLMPNCNCSIRNTKPTLSSATRACSICPQAKATSRMCLPTPKTYHHCTLPKSLPPCWLT